MKYDPKKIESKWQKKWLEEKVFRASDPFDYTQGKPQKQKYYQLETFPYPSAAGLHVGHPKGYIAEDIHARFMRMNGREVLYTMGWDAFGLPTENYAIKVGKSPQEVAAENIKNFKRQVRMFGLSYDWDREINTSSPDYYKWTQWIFIKLWERGLAYRKKAPVNWCPQDQTVLANEQVINGKCERCGAEIEQREMEQWFFRITDYAERLLADLRDLDWPAATIKRQEDWIGKSEGAELDFEIKTDEPPNFVLLHGYKGSPEKNFFPWLKKELENRGYKVQVPALPNPKNPSVYDQVDYVIKTVSFDDNTVIVGHSLGSVVALKVLERINQPARKTVLIGGFTENNFVDNDNFEPNIFDWKFDVKKISKNAGFLLSMRDLTDDAVPQYQPLKLSETFGGQLVDFKAIKPHARNTNEPEVLRRALDIITVFTTRPDTLFGATYMVLAPEHPLVENLKSKIENWPEAKKYIEQAKRKTELQRREEVKNKTGIELAGIKAMNPATKEETPVWVADYVLMGYGTGAIMAVPAHDERDYEFAKKFELPVRRVVHGVGGGIVYVGVGKMVNSGKFDGMDSEKAKWEITKYVGGERKIQYKLRDWSVSRQRYWGCPIPMIYCETCGIVPVPEKDLPVKLPSLEDYRPKGIPPLAASEKFINVKCPKCGGEARRDPETLDTFVDSSWYFLRYTDPHNEKEPFDKKKAAHWLPVDLYVIGAEHTTAHLLYARFITKFMRDAGHLRFGEPFLRLRHQGLILGEDGQKMSKSKGNVVNPDDLINEFGADTVRVYEMFMGPFEQGQPWDPRGVLGANRFLNRVWNYFAAGNFSVSEESPKTTKHIIHKTIKKVSEDIAGFSFNTAISALMVMLNDLEKSGEKISKSDAETALKMIHPFAPHISQELWSRLENDSYLDFEPWPEHNEDLAREEKITVVIQINGKVRDSFEAANGLAEKDARERALKSEKVRKYLGNSNPRKFIYVQDKIINIVI